MPSEDLLQHFQRELKPAARWRVGGEHYQRIAAGWLANLDGNSDRARPLLAATYGTDQAQCWFSYRGYSSWPAPSFGATAAAPNGRLRAICYARPACQCDPDTIVGMRSQIDLRQLQMR